MKFTLFLLSVIVSQTVYPQKYKIDKKPEWVKTIDIPNKSSIAKYEISSGYFLTLADYQVNLDEDAIYNHEVINVFSYSGITKASQLLITYDTSYQKIKLHHLYIWRKGEKIDRTNNLIFEKMNNEYKLNNGVYLGRITEYANLNDIRKDDLIDFAYTLVGKNPIFEKGKYLFIPLETMNPIDLCYIRILYSKDKNYEYKCSNCDSSVVISDTLAEKYRQIEIIEKNVKAFKFEEYTPTWVIPYKYFLLTSFKSWKNVNNWAQRVFALGKEPDLDGVFKEIFTGDETMDDKINKIINYVQDDIRYMGIEAGIGSIKPFPPDKVVKQRFGDCKDKSLLLVSLLKKIGIHEVYPALVNSYMKQYTDSFFPSNEVFDHCIVKFVYGDKTYWVDPTFAQQGSDFKNLGIFDYGKALIIGIPSDSLSEMIPQNNNSFIDFKDEYTIPSFTEPSKLQITSTRYGFEADKRRIYLEQNSAQEISKLVTNDLKRYYPTVNQTDDMIIKDDIKNNVLSTTYKYEIDGFWQDGDKMNDKRLARYWIFKFEPQTLYQEINVSACVNRKFDYGLYFPFYYKYEVIFHFPKDMLIFDKYVKYDNKAFCFDEKIEQLSSNSFKVNYSFKTKSQFVKPDDYEKICEEKNKIAKNLPIVIYFNK